MLLTYIYIYIDAFIIFLFFNHKIFESTRASGATEREAEERIL